MDRNNSFKRASWSLPNHSSGGRRITLIADLSGKTPQKSVARAPKSKISPENLLQISQ
jgi:hypothetical protein